MDQLAKNIRYLRKTQSWSQEEMARQMGVKRSSIAAYESKNVRPRLQFIQDIARKFGLTITQMVETDLEAEKSNFKPAENGQAASHNNGNANGTNGHNTTADPLAGFSPDLLHLQVDELENEQIRDFIEKSLQIKKMLEGFKMFYRFKMDQLSSEEQSHYKVQADIENFILLMEYLLTHNDAVIQALRNKYGQKN